MKHKTLFVFDIETIPDLVTASNLISDEADADNPEASRDFLTEKLKEYHLDITQGKNSFLRQPFHKVVAISFLEADIEYQDDFEYYKIKDLRSGGSVESSEKDLITGLFQYLRKIHPRFISFNGKTFDMPVLKYRAMLYNISLDWFYKSGDKWNNYSSRYSVDWHCDLLEAFSDFGSSARVRMNEVCAMLGLPGKMEIDGSMVEQMYYEGKIQEIRDYCELDVLNTYILYLRYAHHIGKMNRDGYLKSISEIISFLTSGNKEHYNMFLEKWLSGAREEEFEL